jgi:hypothetical protein
MNSDVIGLVIISVMFITCWIAFFRNIRRRGLRIIDVVGVSLSTTGTFLIWFMTTNTINSGDLKVWLIGLMLAAFPPLWFRKWYSWFFMDMFGIHERKEGLVLFRIMGVAIGFLDIIFGLTYIGIFWLLLYKTL